MDIESLNEKQLDVLKEIGNIGAGHAATVLSKLVYERIEMSVPNAAVVPLNKVGDYLGGAEELAVGIFMKVFGDAPGKMLFLFNQDDAMTLVKMVMDQNLENEEEIKGQELEMNRSLLQEVSNIMTSAYLNALTRLTKLNMIPSIPAYACDMMGAIINSVLVDLETIGDYALLIETQFKTVKQELRGNFFLIPDPGALEQILLALGVG